MKKIYLLLCVLFLSTAMNAQTISKEQFSKLSKENKELYYQLKVSDSLKKERVTKFLASNPTVRKTYRNEEGVLFDLRDIIDGKPIYTTTDNANAAKATKTDLLQNGGSMGLDLDGTGMIVGVWDGGPAQFSHPEFQNESNTDTRIISMDSETVDGDTGFSSHGTHVTGTISAKGVNASAKGMATNVTVKSYNWTDDTVEMLIAATDLTSPILLSNHSYGVPVENVIGSPWYMGAYIQDAREIDDIAKNNPKYLIVASAGNSGNTMYDGGLFFGFDKLTGDKNAKNNLVIANASPVVSPFTGELSFTINPGSSQGPTDDLRIKPDIAADGTGLFSTVPTNSYATFSGTSMSAPNTTGTLVLLQEYYNQLNGQYMNSSTLRGLVCHTAVDDVERIGPDPIFGWGFLDAKASAELILKADNQEAVLQELTMATGGSYSMTFGVSEGEKLSATICWTDVRGDAVSNDLNNMTPRLKNDLDLRITKDGTTFFPWKLDFSPDFGMSNSKADNIVDNIERVDIEVPEAGVYTLTVSHKGIIQGATPFVLQIQDYALILTGNSLTLSTNDVALEDVVKIWPNPASNMLNISFQNIIDKTNITLYDIQGREVYTQSLDQFSQNKHHINTSDFSSGMYLLKINVGNQILNKKIVIE